MAIVAADATRRMSRMIELRLLFACFVALHAMFGILFRIGVERENELAGRSGLRIVAMSGLFRVCMRLARAVTHLAASDRVLLLRQRGVCRLAELLELRLMAGAAGFGPGIPGRCHRRYRDCRRRRRCGRRRARLRIKRNARQQQRYCHGHPSKRHALEPFLPWIPMSRRVR